MHILQITKEFTIREVRAALVQNAPFRLVLANGRQRPDSESTLSLNAETLSRLKIPHSLEVLGRKLIGTFTAIEAPTYDEGVLRGYIDTRKCHPDDMGICSLEKRESERPQWVSLPPSKQYESSYRLKLSTFTGADGFHPHPLPCPMYNLELALTPDEYAKCTLLPANSIIRAAFSLLA